MAWFDWVSVGGGLRMQDCERNPPNIIAQQVAQVALRGDGAGGGTGGAQKTSLAKGAPGAVCLLFPEGPPHKSTPQAFHTKSGVSYHSRVKISESKRASNFRLGCVQQPRELPRRTASTARGGLLPGVWGFWGLAKSFRVLGVLGV